MAKHKIPADFQISASMREWADTKTPTLDVDYYHEEFCDHWAANGKMMADWPATWRNWMRRTNTASAPGMFGKLDLVKRKAPTIKTSAGVIVDRQQDAWNEIDRLRNLAIAKGMNIIEARQLSPQQLREAIK